MSQYKNVLNEWAMGDILRQLFKIAEEEDVDS